MTDSARLGRYELLTPLGKGGLGEVFVARLRGESGFERLFAAKRVRRDLGGGERLMTMFFDEARIAACIHSTNVVPVLDVGRDDDGVPYMIMELVIGATVAQLCKHEPLSRELALAVLVDAARGLEDAHAACDPYGRPLSVVHRDVSPNNILVGLDGRARLSDFGLARAADRRWHSQVGEVKGTFAYIAPEQLEGDADRQSDVFALGVIAWELLSCERLFAGDDPLEVLEAVRNKPIPKLCDVARPVGPALSAAVARAVERDRSRRYLRAADFASELVRAAELDGVTIAPPEDVGARAREVAQPLLERVRLGPADAPASEAPTLWDTTAAARPARMRPTPDGSTAPAKRAIAADVATTDVLGGPTLPATRPATLATPALEPATPSAPAALDTIPDPSLARRMEPQRSKLPWIVAAVVLLTLAALAVAALVSRAAASARANPTTAERSLTNDANSNPAGEAPF